MSWIVNVSPERGRAARRASRWAAPAPAAVVDHAAAHQPVGVPAAARERPPTADAVAARLGRRAALGREDAGDHGRRPGVDRAGALLGQVAGEQPARRAEGDAPGHRGVAGGERLDHGGERSRVRLEAAGGLGTHSRNRPASPARSPAARPAAGAARPPARAPRRSRRGGGRRRQDPSYRPWGSAATGSSRRRVRRRGVCGWPGAMPGPSPWRRAGAPVGYLGVTTPALPVPRRTRLGGGDQPALAAELDRGRGADLGRRAERVGVVGRDERRVPVDADEVTALLGVDERPLGLRLGRCCARPRAAARSRAAAAPGSRSG